MKTFWKILFSLSLLCVTSQAQERPGGSVTTTLLTNAIAAYDARQFWAPLDQNINLFNSAARVRSGLPLRIVNFGDDAFQPRIPSRAKIDAFLKWNGTITSAGGNFYADTSSGVTGPALVAPDIALYIFTFGTSGGGMTNRSAVLSDTISFGWYAYSGFSANYTILTNDGTAGGTWTAVKTIAPAGGSTLQLQFTNFSVSPGTWRAAIWTTATNAALFCGQYHSTIGTNYVWDIWESGSKDVINAVTNNTWSNSVVTMLGQYDLAIINDGSQTNQAYTGFPLLANALKTRGFNTDLVFLQPVPQTNSPGLTLSCRQSLYAVAADYGLQVLDTGGMLLPLDPPKSKRYYQSDGVHLSDAGNDLLANKVAAMILTPYVQRQPANQITYLRGEHLTVSGTGTAKNSTVSPGHAPWSDSTMFYQSAANAVYTWAANIPEWATAATVDFDCYTKQGSGIVQWTDTLSPYYSAPQAQVLAPAGNATVSVLASNSLLSHVTLTQIWPVTNAAKYFVWTSGASTNSAARGVVGPIKVTVR